MFVRESLFKAYDEILSASAKIDRFKACEGYLKGVEPKYYCLYNKTFLSNVNAPFSIITNYPKEWQEDYVKKNSEKTNPILLKLIQTQKPFKWDTISQDSVISKDLFEKGVAWCFSVPAICKDQDFSVLTMVFENKYKRDYFFTEYSSKDFQSFVFLFHVIASQARTVYEKVPLTPREIEVLGWLYKGKEYKDIADLENISICTVQGHIKNIYAKLNVENKGGAIYMGHRYGII